MAECTQVKNYEVKEKKQDSSEMTKRLQLMLGCNIDDYYVVRYNLYHTVQSAVPNRTIEVQFVLRLTQRAKHSLNHSS